MIRLTCDACGGSLEIDPGQKVMMCPFCGAKFIEKNVTNNFNIANGQIHADEVNIRTDSLAKDAKLSAAEGHLRLGDFEVAYKILQELVVYFPEDIQVRKAMFDCISMNRTRQEYNKAEFDELEKQYNTIAKIDKGQRDRIRGCYAKALDDYNDKRSDISLLYDESEAIKKNAENYLSISKGMKLLAIVSLIALIVSIFVKPKLFAVFGFLILVFVIGTIVFRVKHENTTEQANEKLAEANELSDVFDNEGIRF